jgi:hypothetical protein
MPSHTQNNSDDEGAGAGGAAGEAGTRFAAAIGAAVGARGSAQTTTNSALEDIFGPGGGDTALQDAVTLGKRGDLEQVSQNQQQLRRDLFADTPMQPRLAEAAQRAPGGQFGPTVNMVTPGFMRGVTGTDGRTGSRGENALNLLGGLIGVQR